MNPADSYLPDNIDDILKKDNYRIAERVRIRRQELRVEIILARRIHGEGSDLERRLQAQLDLTYRQ